MCCCPPREMISKSKEWARQRGLLQTSEVHGQEEWKIPTDKTFTFENETIQSTSMAGTMVSQDRSACWISSKKITM